MGAANRTSGVETPEKDATTAGLLTRLMESVSTLFRKELELFRAELDEKGRQIGAAIGMIAAGGLMSLVALNVLAAALVSAVAEAGIETGWAALIVGGGIALIALILVTRGSSQLKASRLAPERTTRSVSRDAAVMKEVAR